MVRTRSHTLSYFANVCLCRAHVYYQVFLAAAAALHDPFAAAAGIVWTATGFQRSSWKRGRGPMNPPRVPARRGSGTSGRYVERE